VSALYGTQLTSRASNGPGGIQGAEIEDFENTIDAN
jgi:hypothetical protein